MSFAPAQKTQEAWKVAVAHIATTYAAHGARAIIDDLIHRTQLDEAKNLELNAEAFIAHRLSQLRVMSTDYDKLGQRDLQNFVAFLVNATNRDATSPDSVQVITIHHSKGLEYDAVYMPLLEDSKAFGGINHDDLMYEPLGARAATLEDQFKPAWMLKNVHKSVLPLDATIKAGIDNIRAEAAYGSLCRLYVGMTRAKHRLVLMHEKKIKTGKSKEKEVSANFNFLDLTTERLVGDSTYGSSVVRDISIDEIKADRLWVAEGSTREWAVGRDQEESTKAEAKDNAKISGVDYGAVAARRMKKIKPSKGKKAFKASSRSGQHSGKAFGTVVHSLFEGLKWDIDGFIAQSQSKLSKDDATLQDAFKRVEHCLQQPAVRELLLRHQGGELWTEKHAVLRQGTDQYISAVFDRVQVLPGKSAVIVDYKTNTCSGKELVELYQGQMDLYRESVARLCQLPVSAVETWLIHVQETGSEAIKVEPKVKA
jgi:ATP-dependent exoDNAse (exonuclease V) beta subunit